VAIVNWLSGMRIGTNTSTRIEVIDPPWYLFGALMLLAGMMIARAAWPVKGAKNDGGQFEWLAIAFAAPVLLMAIGLLTGESRIILDRSTSRMLLRSTYAWIPWRTVETPLTNVREAIVQYGRSGQAISLVLSNGRTVTLGFHSPRPGHHEAVHAINRFLRSPEAQSTVR
jgi:hypothetical protein